MWFCKTFFSFLRRLWYLCSSYQRTQILRWLVCWEPQVLASQLSWMNSMVLILYLQVRFSLLIICSLCMNEIIGNHEKILQIFRISGFNIVSPNWCLEHFHNSELSFVFMHEIIGHYAWEYTTTQYLLTVNIWS